MLHNDRRSWADSDARNWAKRDTRRCGVVVIVAVTDPPDGGCSIDDANQVPALLQGDGNKPSDRTGLTYAFDHGCRLVNPLAQFVDCNGV